MQLLDQPASYPVQRPPHPEPVTRPPPSVYVGCLSGRCMTRCRPNHDPAAYSCTNDTLWHVIDLLQTLPLHLHHQTCDHRHHPRAGRVNLLRSKSPDASHSSPRALRTPPQTSPPHCVTFTSLGALTISHTAAAAAAGICVFSSRAAPVHVTPPELKPPYPPCVQ